ncbi:MAG: TadE/TadG family type IV pilus assembly protein [Endozoicomonas sp.]
MPSKRSSRQFRQKGLFTIEFALAALLLFTVIFLVFEYSRLLLTWNLLQESTRRGASVAAQMTPGEGVTLEAVRRAALYGDSGSSRLVSGLKSGQVQVNYLDRNGDLVADPKTSSRIRFVQVEIRGYRLKSLFPGLSPGLGQEVAAPVFSTVMPGESLGRSPTL